MNESRLPFFSKPVVATKAPAATETFGFTWQEVVTRVEAFAIEASDKVMEIANYSHDQARNRLTQYVLKDSNHMLVLHPGEYVEKVEASYTKHVITAIKLHTSKRVTPWYGEAKGTRTTFQASDGFCINALCGKYSPNGCSQLGVVYAPKEMALEGHSMRMPSAITKALAFRDVDDDDDDDESDGEGDDDDDDNADYRTWDLAPRAIAIRTGNTTIEHVAVVTAVEYDRFTRFPGSFEHTPGEQWLVLAEGERIKAIGVEADDDSLWAVAFKTTMQTSHIFGTLHDETMEWLTTCEDPEAYICGFEMETSDSEYGNVDRLTVLITTPSRETTTADATLGTKTSDTSHASKAA